MGLICDVQETALEGQCLSNLYGFSTDIDVLSTFLERLKDTFMSPCLQWVLDM